MSTWVVLVYKIPREPAAGRVYIWRKLKRLGALLLHDAVWLLPQTPWTREQFQWLAVEIRELGGEALMWESRMVCGERFSHGHALRIPKGFMLAQVIKHFRGVSYPDRVGNHRRDYVDTTGILSLSD